MADQIRVMISSRNGSPIVLDGKRRSLTYTYLRRKMKTTLEEKKPFGDQLFNVFINEEESRPTTSGPWELSLAEARKADIVIVLYNGDAGWHGFGEFRSIGICHAEMREAIEHARHKVYGIRFDPPEQRAKDKTDENQERLNANFRTYVEQQSLSWLSLAQTEQQALELLQSIIHHALTDMVKNYAHKTPVGRRDHGSALDWSNKTYDARIRAMEAVLIGEFENAGGRPADAGSDAKDRARDDDSGAENRESKQQWLKQNGKRVLYILHAVPEAMSTAAARERVGRPFHTDYLASEKLGKKSARTAGPVHIIACYKGITENQAVALLGRPDVTTIKTNFGVLGVDQISKVQCIFLRDCSDPGAIRHAVLRAFRWLASTGEIDRLVKRAEARKNIVAAIRAEL
ncbi:MAG: hypothetical protein AAF515_11550 [Pseudomonadota bacterium]